MQDPPLDNLPLDNLDSLGSFLPESTLIAGVLLVVFWDLVSRGKSGVIGLVSLTTAALAASGVISAIYLYQQLPPQKLFYELLSFDPTSHLFKTLFAIVGIIIVIFATPAQETGAGTKQRNGIGEFFALLLIISVGLNLMTMSRNLLMIYISIEMVSVMSFVMAGFKFNERKSSEAALKYVIFGALASGIMVYGMSWLYGFAQSLDLAEIAARIAIESGNQGTIPLAVMIGVICVLSGFLFKISGAPFHMWAPDVYEGAPTSVTAFLSVAPKAAGFAIMLRFFHEALRATAESNGDLTPWAFIGGIVAIATMIVGNFSALHQNNIKRMLAYSSIAHAGYILLGFCVFSETGMHAVIFYLIVYAIMNLGAFLIVAAIAERHNGDETIDTYKGLGSRSPLLAVLLTIFLFSLTGLPPFAGFIGKFYLFAALIQSGGNWNWLLAAIAVINSAVSLFYYARIMRAMFLTKPTESTQISTRAVWTVTAVILAIATLVLGVYWAPVYDLVTSSSVW